MVVSGAIIMLLGLALMGYQRLGWPRSDLFAAGSFVVAILGFIAAALAIPGMPRFFNFENEKRSALGVNSRTSTQASSGSTDQSITTRTKPSDAGHPNAAISVPQTTLPAVPQVASTNPYAEVGRLHDRVMSLGHEW